MENLTPIGLGQSCGLFLPSVAIIGPPFSITFYITGRFLPLHLYSLNLNQFSYPEDGGNSFLRSIGKFNHDAMQKSTRRPRRACGIISEQCPDTLCLSECNEIGSSRKDDLPNLIAVFVSHKVRHSHKLLMDLPFMLLYYF